MADRLADLGHDPYPTVVKCCRANQDTCQFSPFPVHRGEQVVILADKCVGTIPCEGAEEEKDYQDSGFVELGWGTAVMKDKKGPVTRQRVPSPGVFRHGEPMTPARRPAYVTFLRHRIATGKTNIIQPGTKDSLMNMRDHIKECEEMKQAFERAHRALDHLDSSITKQLADAYFDLHPLHGHGDARLAAECPFIFINPHEKVLVMSNDRLAAFTHLESTTRLGIRPTTQRNREIDHLITQIPSWDLINEPGVYAARAALELMEMAAEIPPHEAYAFRNIIKHMAHYVNTNLPQSCGTCHNILCRMSSIIKGTPPPPPDKREAQNRWDFGPTYRRLCRILERTDETTQTTVKAKTLRKRVVLELNKYATGTFMEPDDTGGDFLSDVDNHLSLPSPPNYTDSD